MLCKRVMPLTFSFSFLEKLWDEETSRVFLSCQIYASSKKRENKQDFFVLSNLSPSSWFAYYHYVLHAQNLLWYRLELICMSTISLSRSRWVGCVIKTKGVGWTVPSYSWLVRVVSSELGCVFYAERWKQAIWGIGWLREKAGKEHEVINQEFINFVNIFITAFTILVEYLLPLHVWEISTTPYSGRR